VKSLSAKKTAYSLLELSIVIIIIATMISGGLSFFTNSTNNAKIQLTRDRLNTVYKALGVYLIKNGFLPCPSLISQIRSSDADYGGTYFGQCLGLGGASRDNINLLSGSIPVQLLGLSADFAEDGFGSKFTYVVATNFTNSNFGSAAENGLITINDRINSGVTQLITNNAIFVIMSSGINKFGAYGKNSSTMNNIPTDPDELLNYTKADGTSGKVFYASSDSSDEFDDIVIFKTRDELVLDFDALDLIFCRAADGNQTLTYGTSTVNYTWPQTRYGQVSPANEDCPTTPVNYKVRNARPLKKCGALGVWDSFLVAQCYAS
jgi:type II secretory pathway pseudopilin PulG